MSVSVHHGDMLQVLPGLVADSFHACVTDPPYHLTSIVKRFGAANAAPAKVGQTGAFARASRGFMGKQWDGGDIAFRPETWVEVLRVLKPGAHLVAFGGTRTFHRMAVAIEDAGFELRDTLMYLYGSGFPKSHNAGNGWGTALKPAWEPIILARKPLRGTVAANVLAHGCGALNIDGCRVPASDKAWGSGNRDAWRETEGRTDRQPNSYGQSDASPGARWPANVLHDGSNEVLQAFPDAPGQQRFVGAQHGKRDSVNAYGDYGIRPDVEPRNDAGSAARFFYTAKATAEDRVGSKHPTVKPLALMRYLVRLVCPPGGTILDPFAGSGTTGMACLAESFNATLIEREAEYVADIKRRIAHVVGLDTPLFVPPPSDAAYDRPLADLFAEPAA